MNAAKLFTLLVLPLVGLVLVGMVAIWAFKALLGLVVYLLIGAGVVIGGMYLYGRAKKAVGSGTRTRYRIDAAAETYRQRNR
ncbi:hypothetical protein Val02_38020 [Virgisporangium aliadipatigenens]|uniref:Uncharacterized protein n=1 Tax=Virgisporangium aliadipatigenens TaxID=741659 RepID=A0A8J4DRC2_9ACTN|nr:hypothetical protein [Virgisporangium aliadipatigenens]GIJ46916.1 hypothetical protein Val02_38020 [Virgisporangium aliadipatigenens]